jgi:hypothetical protein
MKYKGKGRLGVVVYIWVMFFFVCLAIAASLWLRMHNFRRRNENGWQSISFQETKPSQLSNAVQGLMATAGGVYLSLVMLVSFLKINVPSVINMEFLYASFDLTVDPLALTAILLAIIEPVFIKLIALIRKIDFL